MSSPTPKRARRGVLSRRRGGKSPDCEEKTAEDDLSRPIAELTKWQKVEMEEVFNIFDIDKNGSINGFELKIALRALGFLASNEECAAIMQRYTSQPGHPFDALNVEEFCRIISEENAKKKPEDEIREAFELFDIEDKGSITVKNLRSALNQLGKGNLRTDEQLQQEIDRWDKDRDGRLNFEEFKAIMLNQ